MDAIQLAALAILAVTVPVSSLMLAYAIRALIPEIREWWRDKRRERQERRIRQLMRQPMKHHMKHKENDQP